MKPVTSKLQMAERLRGNGM